MHMALHTGSEKKEKFKFCLILVFHTVWFGLVWFGDNETMLLFPSAKCRDRWIGAYFCLSKPCLSFRFHFKHWKIADPMHAFSGRLRVYCVIYAYDLITHRNYIFPHLFGFVIPNCIKNARNNKQTHIVSDEKISPYDIMKNKLK